MYIGQQANMQTANPKGKLLKQPPESLALQLQGELNIQTGVRGDHCWLEALQLMTCQLKAKTIQWWPTCDVDLQLIWARLALVHHFHDAVDNLCVEASSQPTLQEAYMNKGPREEDWVASDRGVCYSPGLQGQMQLSQKVESWMRHVQ